MGRQKELTDRDKELLSLLARCRVLEIDDVARVYGVKDYHRARVRELSERGYLLRRKGYVEIAQKGLQEMVPGAKVTPVRDDRQRSKLAEFARMYFALKDNWEFVFASEYKRQIQAVSFARFGAVIARDGVWYAVYLLPSAVRDTNVEKLRQEIGGLPRYGITCAVVFHADEKAALQFGDDPCGLKSLLLLPYPDGLDVVNRRDDIYSFIRSKYPRFSPCSRPCADLEHGDTYISILVDNDLTKQKYLRDYLERVQEMEGRTCVGVCLPNQKEQLAEAFPRLKLVVIPEKLINRRALSLPMAKARGFLTPAHE